MDPTPTTEFLALSDEIHALSDAQLEEELTRAEAAFQAASEAFSRATRRRILLQAERAQRKAHGQWQQAGK